MKPRTIRKPKQARKKRACYISSRVEQPLKKRLADFAEKTGSTPAGLIRRAVLELMAREGQAV